MSQHSKPKTQRKKKITACSAEVAPAGAQVQLFSLCATQGRVSKCATDAASTAKTGGAVEDLSADMVL